jgi:hypothetical protein
MNIKLKISLAAFSLVAFAGIAIGQSGLWPNFPIVGGSSYSCGSVNGVSNCTVPAGPTALTGNETIPANTNLSQGRSPQNVLLKPANLNANPITISEANLTANLISASSVSGGIFLPASTTITGVNVTLPPSPIDGQQYVFGSNRNIVTLQITASSGDNMGANTAPTALTASTTAPQGYRFICSLSNSVCTWFRLQ